MHLELLQECLAEAAALDREEKQKKTKEVP
jgi:hypothetical protein